MRTERDAWREQARRLALPKPEPATSWWRLASGDRMRRHRRSSKQFGRGFIQILHDGEVFDVNAATNDVG